MLDVKIKLLHGGQPPVYATAGAAAADIRAAVDEPVTIEAGGRFAVPSGFAVEVPEGYAAIVCGRSGLAKKYGVSLANGIGVIDSDYRGEVCVLLINHGNEPFTVNPGERVAQLMMIPVAQASFIAADALGETERGEGGFGSTGVK